MTARDAILDVYAGLLRRVVERRPLSAAALRRLPARIHLGCPEANAEHRESRRQYAHVGHLPRTICLAYAARRLGRRHIRGLLAHELGHLLAGHAEGLRDDAPERVREDEADAAALKFLGVRVRYGRLALQYA